MTKALSFHVALAVIVVSMAVIPEPAAQGLGPDDYGITDTNYHYVSAEDFQETARGYYMMSSDGFWMASTTPTGSDFVASLRLPAGALVDGYTVIYEDSDAVDNLGFELYRHWVGAFGATGTAQIGTTFTSSGTPGVRSTWVDLDPDLIIDYYIAVASSTQSYVLKLVLPSSLDLGFRGVIVQWNRQVSPAPASATFADVGTGHWAFQFVEALAASGITGGCGGGNFCPNNPITRAEMAVFLSGALGLHWSP